MHLNMRNGLAKSKRIENSNTTEKLLKRYSDDYIVVSDKVDFMIMNMIINIEGYF